MNHFTGVSTTESSVFQLQIVFDELNGKLAVGGTVKLCLAVAGTGRRNVTR
jgi:hypothetical protein